MGKIDYSNIDYAHREGQEDTDYGIAVEVFSGLFNSGFTLNFEKREPWSIDDMRFTASTKNNKEYTHKVEIKTRNQDMSKYHDLPIKCDKLARLRGICGKNDRLLYFVICNYSEWYLFDLNAVDLNKCRLEMWHIPITQYAKDKSKVEYEDAPTFFIPVKEAIKHGILL